MNIPEPLRNPWVLGGTVFIAGVAWFVYKRAGSGGGEVGPSGVIYQPSSSNGYADQVALQNKQLDLAYQSKLNDTEASIQLAELQTKQNADYMTQLSAMRASDNATQLELAKLQIAGSVQLQSHMDDTSIALKQIDAVVSANSNQTDITLAQIARASGQDQITGNLAYQAAKIAGDLAYTDKLFTHDESMAHIAADTATTLNSQNTAAAIALNDANNATAQLAIQTQGDVYHHAIDAQAGVENNYISTIGGVYQSMIDADAKTKQGIVSGINAGVYNKGGEGGTNQVAVVSAVLNQPAIGVAAMGTQAVDEANNGIGSILNGVAGIANAIKP